MTKRGEKRMRAGVVGAGHMGQYHMLVYAELWDVELIGIVDTDASTVARLAAQYDTYKPFPDLSVNGEQTLGENIADNAGISAAYDGYRTSLAGKPAPVQDGFSGDQQFFIAFGQNWGSKSREDTLRQQVMTDPHSPAEYRSDMVRNVDAWYPAFNVQPGEKLYLAPPDRVQIW